MIEFDKTLSDANQTIIEIKNNLEEYHKTPNFTKYNSETANLEINLETPQKESIEIDSDVFEKEENLKLNQNYSTEILTLKEHECINSMCKDVDFYIKSMMNDIRDIFSSLTDSDSWNQSTPISNFSSMSISSDSDPYNLSLSTTFNSENSVNSVNSLNSPNSSFSDFDSLQHFIHSSENSFSLCNALNVKTYFVSYIF